MNINDCASDPCINGTCSDLVNAYSCYCQVGFTGTNCDINIDDCATNPCVNGTCADLVNGYSCMCQAGYTGTNCDINIDDCASNPCVNGTCTDLVNAYNCTCQAGFTGTNCDVELCTLTCANGGTLDVINCTCDCLPQFTGDSCDVVVDECAPNPCQNNGTCNNIFPGFECMCVVGYTGMTCEVCATGYMMESGQCGKHVCMCYLITHLIGSSLLYSSRL